MPSNYDAIARFYDVDMARNMPFDDVAFYAALCARQGGRVLELGCGNGRILLALLARGIDALGVDASAGMLAELRAKAAARGVTAPVARMDVTRLALRPGFSVILCPYSLITYLTGGDDVPRLLASVRALLAPDGLFVLDAFVPRPIVAQPAFSEDYRRAFGTAELVRSKRITPLPDGRNRIERRYRLMAGEAVIEAVDVDETIRPWAPEALCAALMQGGLEPVETWWDYGSPPPERGPQFCTIAARVAPATA